ncbi:hypothetical protein GPJ56_006073 [Histomonas meleagridis]|uniref:uncharacterized protein n=1 Tax=Histomonas meleagridis TaxID=135588 RepID=UPI00355A4915|nr:hypothetical protein GPJ56_006073 [Histomonas meleagridis]KAH0807181.1 hypothetical protein GO595_000357 [Histomonas meleagridis]
MFERREENQSNSFTPVVQKVPVDIPEYSRSKTVGDIIYDSFSFPTFENLLYSFTETNLLRTKHPKPEVSVELVNSTIEKTNVEDKDSFFNSLELLNAMFLFKGKDGLEIFKESKLPSTLLSWVKPNLSPQASAFLINLISLNMDSMALTESSLIDLLKLTIESFILSSGTLAKKLLILTNLILSKLLGKVNEPQLNYSFAQNPVISSSFNNPITFQFLLSNEIPSSFAVGEQIIKENTHQPDILRYLTTGEFDKQPKNATFHKVFISIASLLPNFVKQITSLCQKSSRFLNSNVSIDLCFSSLNESMQSKGIQIFDSSNERDILYFSIWSNTYLFLKIFEGSNVMEAEIFKNLIFSNSNSNLPLYCFQSHNTDIRQVFSSTNFVPELFAISIPEEESFKILPNAFAISLHITADLVSHSPARVQQFVTDKQIRNIHSQAESSENEFVMQEAAYALSKYLRWMPKPKAKPIPRLIGFVYDHLEEFEMFEKLSSEGKTDVIPVVTEQKNLENMKEYCANIGVNIFQ